MLTERMILESIIGIEGSRIGGEAAIAAAAAGS